MSNKPKYRHGSPVPDQDSTDAEAATTDRTEMADSLRDRVPVVGGLVTGVGAFLTTFLVVGATTFSSRNSTEAWSDLESPPSVLTEAVWTLLMNLGAELQLGDEPISTSSMSMYRLMTLTASPLYTILVFGIIVGAGFAVAECVRTDSPVERFAGSLLVVPGYLVLSVALASVSTWEVPPSGDVVQTPSRAAQAGQEMSVAVTDAAIYAGLLVPAAFALLGGGLAVGHRRWTEHRDSR